MIPVAYGAGLAERVRTAAPGQVTAVQDNHGREAVEAGLELGVDPARIITIVDSATVAKELGVTVFPPYERSAAVLQDIAALVTAGTIRFAVEATFPLDQVRDAFTLARRPPSRRQGRGPADGRLTTRQNADTPEEAMPRIRLDIAYDGTGFNGWAIQPGQRTVQGLLESTLATILRAPARLVVAGRTDAGVHASGQVAHVDIEEDRLAYLSRRKQPIPALVATKINGIAGLKADLVVKRSTIAPEGFDARFSPLWRRYQYRIADEHAERDPLRRVNTLWFPAVLDITAMQRAAQELLGLHDWAAYCRPRQGATTIRDLLDFSWQRDATGVLVAELRADAFCHSMVRALVGATVSVGEGKLPGDRLLAIRETTERSNEFKTMPAHGLTLVEVGYPPDDEMLARAELTRSRRDAE